MVRPGFSIVEVLVAVVLLTTGVLGLAAVTEAAGRILRRAAAQEAAVAVAALVLDSLLDMPGPGPGLRREGFIAAQWQVSGGGPALLQLRVWLGEDTLASSWSFAALHAQPRAGP